MSNSSSLFVVTVCLLVSRDSDSLNRMYGWVHMYVCLRMLSDDTNAEKNANEHSRTTTILSRQTMSLAAIALVALLFAPGVRPNGTQGSSQGLGKSSYLSLILRNLSWPNHSHGRRTSKSRAGELLRHRRSTSLSRHEIVSGYERSASPTRHDTRSDSLRRNSRPPVDLSKPKPTPAQPDAHTRQGARLFDVRTRQRRR